MTSVTHGKQTINYALNRTDRKTLAITVKPNMSVVVSAPRSAEQEDIERILRKRAAWIVRQQRFFAQFLPRTPASLPQCPCGQCSSWPRSPPAWSHQRPASFHPAGPSRMPASAPIERRTCGLRSGADRGLRFERGNSSGRSQPVLTNQRRGAAAYLGPLLS